MRLLPATIATPSQLGLPPQLSSLLLKPEGLIVFTGATGQGKSTTQASLIDEVNRTTSRFIITLEDPIEYRHTSMQSVVDQRELGRDLVDFASALRHIVRQRPDIVMIAEMRDTQSIKSTLTLAETGHLVLSTLHTGDAVQAVARIVEEHPPEQQQLARSQLANVLLAVVHQRLVPGASGRLVMAAEVLMNTPAVARLIREGHTEQLYGAMELEHQAGSQTINQALAALVQQGRVLPGEAERFLISRESTALTPRGRKSR